MRYSHRDRVTERQRSLKMKRHTCILREKNLEVMEMKKQERRKNKT